MRRTDTPDRRNLTIKETVQALNTSASSIYGARKRTSQYNRFIIGLIATGSSYRTNQGAALERHCIIFGTARGGAQVNVRHQILIGRGAVDVTQQYY